jgi:antitoxin Phd
MVSEQLASFEKIGYIIPSRIFRRERMTMMVNTANMVSITEANQNFSKIAHMVDASGSVVIMKNNAPKYVLIEYKQVEKEAVASDEEVMAVTERLMQKNMEVLKVLAK